MPILGIAIIKYGINKILMVKIWSLEQRELVRILSTRIFINIYVLLALYERTRK